MNPRECPGLWGENCNGQAKEKKILQDWEKKKKSNSYII